MENTVKFEELFMSRFIQLVKRTLLRCDVTILRLAVQLDRVNAHIKKQTKKRSIEESIDR